MKKAQGVGYPLVWAIRVCVSPRFFSRFGHKQGVDSCHFGHVMEPLVTNRSQKSGCINGVVVFKGLCLTELCEGQNKVVTNKVTV